MVFVRYEFPSLFLLEFVSVLGVRESERRCGTKRGGRVKLAEA